MNKISLNEITCYPEYEYKPLPCTQCGSRKYEKGWWDGESQQFRVGSVPQQRSFAMRCKRCKQVYHR
jgi:hypothetical protein